MTVPTPEVVTLREVYTLVDSKSREMLAELRTVETTFNTWVDAHNKEHKADEQAAASRIRWAVTTLVSAAGILTAIVLPFVIHR